MPLALSHSPTTFGGHMNYPTTDSLPHRMFEAEAASFLAKRNGG